MQDIHLSYRSRVSAYKQPLLYNLSVTKKLFKQIYVKEGLQPPSLEAYRSAYISLWTQVKNPGFVRDVVRSGDLGGYLRIAGLWYLQSAFFLVMVSRMQVLNRWLIGKIIGRRILVGYKLLIIRAVRGTGDQ